MNSAEVQLLGQIWSAPGDKKEAVFPNTTQQSELHVEMSEAKRTQLRCSRRPVSPSDQW